MRHNFTKDGEIKVTNQDIAEMVKLTIRESTRSATVAVEGLVDNVYNIIEKHNILAGEVSILRQEVSELRSSVKGKIKWTS